MPNLATSSYESHLIRVLEKTTPRQVVPKGIEVAPTHAWRGVDRVNRSARIPYAQLMRDSDAPA